MVVVEMCLYLVVKVLLALVVLQLWKVVAVLLATAVKVEVVSETVAAAAMRAGTAQGVPKDPLRPLDRSR